MNFQGYFPVDHGEGLERDELRGERGRRHSDGVAKRDQVRNGNVSYTVHAAVQVGIPPPPRLPSFNLLIAPSHVYFKPF